MRRWWRLVTFLTFATACFPASAAPPTVDNLGDPARIRVEGGGVITPERVRHALARDTEYQLAATPSAPLDELVQTIHTQLGMAYQRSGFAEPTIRVSQDAAGAAIVVKVTEGRQLNAGPLIVEGAVQADAKRLAEGTLARTPARFPMQTAPDGGRRIRSWAPPEEPRPPLWKQGSPAPLDPETQKRIGADFANEMARQGLFQPRIQIIPQPQGDTARLVIRIHEEGNRATLDSIEIKGVKRNKSEDIIRHLGLREGMPLDTDLLQEMAAKLWNSARFWKHTITASPVPGTRGGKIKLTLELDEHPRASLLKDPPTLDETAMLRIRDWLQAAAAGQHDLVFAVQRPEAHARLVVRSGGGFVFRARPGPAGASPVAPAESLATDFGLVATPDRVAFHNVTDRQTVLSRPDWSAGRVSAQISFAPNLEPDAETKSSFAIGLSVQSKNPRKLAGIVLDVTLAPVCFLEFAHPAKPGGAVSAQAKDGVVSLTVGGYVFRFRHDTGELVDATTHDAAGATFHFTAQRGALEREARALEEAVGQPQMPDAQPAPAVVYAAAAHFIADFAAANARFPPEPRRRAIAVARELGRQVGLWIHGLDTGPLGDEEFRVPADFAKVAQTAGPLGFAGELVPHVDHLFPRASWPWTVSRESLLLLGNRGKHTKTEVARLYRSPDFGPVGCLAVAYGYSHLDAQTARVFAKRGLERLTPEYFARDCQALFQPDAPQASLPSRALRTLGRLEPADVDAISALLPPDLAAPFKLLARHYRTSPDNPLPADLQAQLWDAGIKGSVESALKTLSTLP